MKAYFVKNDPYTPKYPVADRDYFLDENGEVTTDPEKGAIWLVRKGIEIAPEITENYGIGKEKGGEK